MNALPIFEEFATLLESDSDEVWSKQIFDLAKELGFEQSLFAVLKSKYEPIENAFLRSNYSPAWRSTYDANKFGYVDPTVSHCMNSTIPLVWTPEAFTNPAQESMYEEATSYGLRYGVILPIHGANGEFGMFSFASEALANPSSRKDLLNAMPLLTLIRDYAFESSKKFVPDNGSKDISLTPREFEVLKWTMAGKSAWEQAKILNCSQSTINFHMSNIRHKFNTTTIQQAIIKAIKLGIIQP